EFFGKIYAVIATQRARWCGNPPFERNQVTITAKNRNCSHSSGRFSVHFPSNRGFATPVCALARNDSVIFSAHLKQQFIVLFSKNCNAFLFFSTGEL
ncbi:MAG: hypothetical protein MR763_02060, partial [Clostridiales bacterium]|nr:hypothetical protein [Clostridiales bacterium]